MHWICSPSARWVGSGRMQRFFVSQGPAFVHRAARVAGSQQTLIALRPKAATFKQGHSSSHGKGKWSLVLILNHPPAAVYKVIREVR